MKSLIDLGSNSIKAIAIKEPSTGLLWHCSETGRLAEGRDEAGNLSHEAIRRNLEIIKRMLEALRLQGAKAPSIFATEAARRAPNRAALAEAILQETGIELQILSSEEEARLSYLAAAELFDEEEGLVADLGGASLELGIGNRAEMRLGRSLAWGALELCVRFIGAYPPSRAELLAMQDFVKSELAGLGQYQSPVLVGGSFGCLKGIQKGGYKEETLHGSVLDETDLRDLEQKMTQLSLRELAELPGMQAGREHSVLGGLVVAKVLLKQTGAGRMKICTRGWRHILLETL